MADRKMGSGSIPATGRGTAQGMVREKPAASGGGSAVGEDSASSATEYLKSQHPQSWNDLGPHHHK